MPLDLLVPDLLLPSGESSELRTLRLPALERWLARADFTDAPGAGPHEWLATEHGLALPAPIAAIALAGEGVDREGAWMRADPVHLRVDHDALVLHDPSVLDIHGHEATALVAALQRHFAADGLEFVAPSPSRWYVRARDGTLPRTTALRDAARRNVFGLLPEGGGYNWRSALTEAQMVFAAHEVNHARESAGALPVNSIWLWGEGMSPASVAPRYASVHADDPFARGLGLLSGAAVSALPRSIDALDLARQDDRVLAVVDTLGPALQRGDVAAWRSGAVALDEAWFAKLGEARARFGTVRVILPAAQGTRVATLDASARWRFFRPRRPLAAHA